MLDRLFVFLYNACMKDLKYLQLWDAYGAMLTDNQREICELYYMCDLSLSEIAEQKGVTKQSVSDALSKSRAILDEYEDKLHFNQISLEYSLQISRMLTRTHRALEAFKAAHSEYNKEIDEIISLMEIDGEHIVTVTVQGEAE